VASYLVGSDAFQETDVTGVTLPITKHNYLVMDVNELPQVLAEAFYIARSGRPGPVLVDICKDVQFKTVDYEPITQIQMRGYRAIKPQGKQDLPALLRRAKELIDHARRPIILAGQGIKHGNAHDELREFVEKSGIPVATTLLALACSTKTTR